MTWTIPDDAGPIIFSGEMVRRLLAGQKRVTRRLVQPQPQRSEAGGDAWRVFRPAGRLYLLAFGSAVRTAIVDIAPKRWTPGRLLYVREVLVRDGDVLRYAADGGRCEIEDEAWFRQRRQGGRPAIHVPKWSSRVLVRVVDLRAEQLREMDEADAVLEGIEDTGDPQVNLFNFSTLWDEINGKRVPWVSDPWVYRIAFDVEAVREGSTRSARVD